MNLFVPRFNGRNHGYALNWLLCAILLSILINHIWSGNRFSENNPLRLVVYAFSTQEEVLTQGLFPAFEHAWESENGRELTIEGVFGPSGMLAGQINLGAPADIAIFSNQRHLDVESVFIAATPLVIVTRVGNPAELMTFADLTQPGLHLLHADPRSSGVGEWAVLSEYGSAYLKTGDHETAETQLKDI
jgi:sulfate transport system substrate-binding protein